MARFRFAPSPTGVPHIGNLHTALFSWALARAGGGDFILRIDDTDAARNDEAAVAQMLNALEWLGLDWNEGPDIGGPFAPYVQSQRRPRHTAVAAQLIAAGAAYHDQSAEGQPLRLALPKNAPFTFTDALRGDITIPAGQLEDPIIVRSDGAPLYHLATVVDDHDMEVTHVVRGEEWLSTTPIHSQIYRALGWAEPEWVHLPLILNRAGKKLSKREGERGYLITDFQAAGYLPQALFNYLLLLGWSPPGTEEIVGRASVRQMTIERLSASPAIFDWDKLNWLNRHYLGRLGDGDLAQRLRPYLEDYYGPLPSSDEWLLALTRLLRPELDRLADAPELAAWAFDEGFEMSDEARQALQTEAAKPTLAQLVAELAQLVLLDAGTAEAVLRALRGRLKEQYGWSAAAVLHPIRAALSGQTGGPPLPQMMALLGKERCLLRLAAALRMR